MANKMYYGHLKSLFYDPASIMNVLHTFNIRPMFKKTNQTTSLFKHPVDPTTVLRRLV